MCVLCFTIYSEHSLKQRCLLTNYLLAPLYIKRKNTTGALKNWRCVYALPIAVIRKQQASASNSIHWIIIAKPDVKLLCNRSIKPIRLRFFVQLVYIHWLLFIRKINARFFSIFEENTEMCNLILVMHLTYIAVNNNGEE